jgi:PAS domain-containing protein
MPDSGSPSRKALKVALLYALAAALWIAVSDPLAGRLADLPTLFTRISLVKGWAFVGVTAALLFWLLRRDYAELEQAATAARESEQVLKNVLETLPVGVWLLDGQGRIVFGNRVNLPLAEAAQQPGVLRSKAVTPPPQADGKVRVVEIAGLDRQACGGTHLTSTGQSRPLRILKVENKGRHNRRVKIGLADR